MDGLWPLHGQLFGKGEQRPKGDRTMGHQNISSASIVSVNIVPLHPMEDGQRHFSSGMKKRFSRVIPRKIGDDGGGRAGLVYRTPVA